MLFLHCYLSDLKVCGEEVMRLVHDYQLSSNEYRRTTGEYIRISNPAPKELPVREMWTSHPELPQVMIQVLVHQLGPLFRSQPSKEAVRSGRASLRAGCRKTID